MFIDIDILNCYLFSSSPFRSFGWNSREIIRDIGDASGWQIIQMLIYSQIIQDEMIWAKG